MNRPNELIKELEEFNEIMYGYELCSSECKELTDYISILEKALDIACYELEKKNYHSEEEYEKTGCFFLDREWWKEYLLNESEKE